MKSYLPQVIEDGAGHSFLRQRSLDEDFGHLIIPFDYQCVGEGRFLVTYIPRSAGLHYITILSQGVNIQGSPFEVKVRCLKIVLILYKQNVTDAWTEKPLLI